MSSDIEPNVRETYKLNFGEYPYGDVSQIASEDIPTHDILCAGFPCQPFSIAGKRLGFEDARGTLFFEVARIIKDKQPKAVFLENVAGLTNHDGGKTLEVIGGIIAEMGYSFHHTLINAKNQGIPQNRNRWYGVAFRGDIDSTAFAFPPDIPPSVTLEDIIKPTTTVNEKYKVTELATQNIMKHLETFKQNPRYNEEGILIANEVRASRCAFSCNGIMPCLTAKMGTGGGNVPVIVAQMRQLTEWECLELMGYPEGYKLEQAKSHSYKQIGNSVCIPVVERIAREITKAAIPEETENKVVLPGMRVQGRTAEEFEQLIKELPPQPIKALPTTEEVEQEEWRGEEKMLNSFNVIGRLTDEPKVRVTSNGIPVLDFAIACEQDIKNKDGIREADFFDCEAWRQSAEYLDKYAGKGDLLSVSGRMKTEHWKDKEGNHRKKLKVQVEKVNVVSKKRQPENQQAQGDYMCGTNPGTMPAQGQPLPPFYTQGYSQNNYQENTQQGAGQETDYSYPPDEELPF